MLYFFEKTGNGKSIFYSLLVSVFIVCFSALSVQAEILVDMSQSTGEAVSISPAQFRINDIDVSYPNPETGVIEHFILDVVIEWDPASLSFKPVDVVGCQGGQLRVQVGSSITGEPLQGAVVQVDGRSVFTDEDGIARFDRLPNRPIVVRIEKEGYQPEGMIIEIPCTQWMAKAVRLLKLP